MFYSPYHHVLKCNRKTLGKLGIFSQYTYWKNIKSTVVRYLCNKWLFTHHIEHIFGKSFQFIGSFCSHLLQFTVVQPVFVSNIIHFLQNSSTKNLHFKTLL